MRSIFKKTSSLREKTKIYVALKIKTTMKLFKVLEKANHLSAKTISF